jgi:hypothetical protein
VHLSGEPAVLGRPTGDIGEGIQDSVADQRDVPAKVDGLATALQCLAVMALRYEARSLILGVVATP